MNIPPKYEDVVAQLEALRDLHAKQCCVFCNDTGNLRSAHKALQQRLTERTRKHLRSCQLAIGKSQLAKELQQRLTVAEQLLSQVEGVCDLAINAIDDDESRANFFKIIRALKDRAALNLAEEGEGS